ncbi:hypothetical protein FHU36_001675 [Nonomuraea muscovyensis]|uniref:Uncharacterized protein n=1 Tax=Nonomuraea muscovyensis TaxID=1124761 RepID=A0A7X0BZW3_9ACTN|nr:hypothetical protein [Nonomuraea muscovyensis]MBB6345166.1 hypothetical protein [Nonomuraea muscovyensis]
MNEPTAAMTARTTTGAEFSSVARMWPARALVMARASFRVQAWVG